MLSKDTMCRYIAPVGASIIVFVSVNIGGLLTNQEDIRYFLSALSQVEATLIGLYITILLVGIQLVRDYSEVFYEVYFRDKEFWVIVGSTILLIVASLVTLGASERLMNPISINETKMPFTIKPSSFLATWATFNIISMIVLLRKTFRLFYPVNLLRAFIDSFPFDYPMGKNGLSMYFRAISKSIQTQNIEISLFILGYIVDERLDKLLSMLSNDKDQHQIDIHEKLIFLRQLFYNFRNLCWYTLDQFHARRISRDEAKWILEIVHRAFQKTLPKLIIGTQPHNEQLENTITQILFELELIIEKLQVSELSDEMSKKFCSLVQYEPYKIFNNVKPQIESIEKICKES